LEKIVEIVEKEIIESVKNSRGTEEGGHHCVDPPGDHAWKKRQVEYV
jgi:hypothetical protein